MSQSVFAFDFEDKSKSLEADYGDSICDYWTCLELAYPSSSQVTILAGSRCKLGTYFIKFDQDETLSIDYTPSQTDYYINLDIDFVNKTSNLGQSSTFQTSRSYTGITKFTILKLIYHGGNFNTKYFQPLYHKEKRIELWAGNSKITNTDQIKFEKDIFYFSNLIFKSNNPTSPIIKTSSTLEADFLTENSYTGITMTNVANLSATQTYNKYFKKVDNYTITGSEMNAVGGSPPITQIIGVYDYTKTHPKI